MKHATLFHNFVIEYPSFDPEVYIEQSLIATLRVRDGVF